MRTRLKYFIYKGQSEKLFKDIVHLYIIIIQSFCSFPSIICKDLSVFRHLLSITIVIYVEEFVESWKWIRFKRVTRFTLIKPTPVSVEIFRLGIYSKINCNKTVFPPSVLKEFGLFPPNVTCSWKKTKIVETVHVILSCLLSQGHSPKIKVVLLIIHTENEVEEGFLDVNIKLK